MQLRHEREHLTVHHRNLETETLTCQRAVGSLEAQAAHVPRFRGMFEVERKISNTQQADALRLRADRVQISQRLDSSNEKVAQLEARCSEFLGIILSPHGMREMKRYLSQVLEWMHME